MSKVKVYNQAGKPVGEISLEPKVFNIPVKPELIQQAVRTLQANSRQVLAHTKDRSEVRGGGRKPWRQKGTGRARHGSIRSPIWIGGGVTFGPRSNKNYQLKMNKKAKRKALLMALSDKAADKKIIIVDKLELPEVKTKMLVSIIKALPCEKKVLIVLDKGDVNIIKSANNIPSVNVVRADSLNIIDILAYDTIICTKSSLPIINSTYVTS